MTGRPAAASQAFAIFESLDQVLREAGSALEAVARLIVYVDDLADFLPFELASRQYLPIDRPALSCVVIPRVSPVPGARLCVEATAVLD